MVPLMITILFIAPGNLAKHIPVSKPSEHLNNSQGKMFSPSSDELQYSQVCNEVLTASDGSIKSPNFPSNYPNNVNCCYLIKNSNPAARITIRFSQFNLESQSTCRYDSVKIYDGDLTNYTQFGPIYGYCGDRLPPTLTSTRNAILVVFVSDLSVTSSGFNMTYKVEIPTTAAALTSKPDTTAPISGCNEVHKSENGSIKSPNFPSNYPINSNCRYLIKNSDPAAKITLNFLNFSLESQETCRYDFVKIYDGDSTNAAQIGPTYGFCGHSKPASLNSTGNAVLIVFISDLSSASSGFHITYSVTLPTTSQPSTTLTTAAVPRVRVVAGSAPMPTQPGPSCGKTAILRQYKRVIGGSTATRGIWPWQVLILIHNFAICGGTLVAPNWVVTAAHCLKGTERSPGLFKVRVGEHDTTVTSNGEVDLSVQRIILHPSFSRITLDYDIALMQLSRPAMINQYVSPACLPAQAEQVPVGTQCFITGWGKIQHPGTAHHILQQASIPIVSKTNCTNKNTRNLGMKITDRMICAGDGGATTKSACHKDSGGPLVCHTGVNGTWVLHGIVSWGSGRCDATEAYTVFARVSYFRNWINLNIRTYSQASG